MHHFVLPKLRLVFSQRTCPIHFFRPKTKFLAGFVQFRCREVQVVRSGFGVHKMHHFVLPKLRLVFSQRTCPILFFRPKTKFLGSFVRFRCLEVSVMRTGFGCIQCTTLCYRSCVLFFRNEHAQSTSLGPKLSFWVVSRDSVAGTYKLLFRVLGCIKCNTLCFRSCVLFSQRTCPIHFFRPKTKFLGGFLQIRCREVPIVRSGFGVHKMHHFVLPKLSLVFSQRTCPIHFFRPKTKFLGGFARFRCREVPVVRS